MMDEVRTGFFKYGKSKSFKGKEYDRIKANKKQIS